MMQKNGFTLIELSIVLVIVGLLAAGILVGRDMIRAAEIRATIQQLEQFNAAANTFKTKYNCLPGDCPNASDYDFVSSSNGNGDGAVGTCDHVSSSGCSYTNLSNGPVMHETVDFWYHLSNAGLIPGSYAPASSITFSGGPLFVTPGPGVISPPAKIKAHKPPGINNSPGGWMVRNDMYFDPTSPANSLGPRTFTLSGNYSTFCCGSYGGGGLFGSYAPSDMYAIDAKIDDGTPLAGSVKAWASVAAMGGGGGFSTNTSGSNCQPLSYNTNTNPNAVHGVSGGQCGSSNACCTCSQTGTAPFTNYNVQYSGTSSAALCNLAVKASF